MDNSIQKAIEKEINQLEENPYVGKPLGYKFFREKKVNNYRVYYLIYDKEVVVFIVSLSNKKEQQRSINTIKSLIPFYSEKIKEKINND